MTEQKHLSKSDVLERLRFLLSWHQEHSFYGTAISATENAIALVEQLPDPINDEREAFEAWASVPPREWSLTRFSDEAAWPGAYADYAVHCAWDAWKDRAAVPDDDAREREVAELRKFAQLIMQAWPSGDVDGGDLQDIAIGCGLLKPTEMTEPCGEFCNCADVDNFPMTCYRATGLLTGAQQQEPEQ